MTDESHKTVSFYSLKNTLDWMKQQSNGDRKAILPPVLRQHRNFKKVTDLKRVQADENEGLLISDRTGEIGFINVKNIQHLPQNVDDKTETQKDPEK